MLATNLANLTTQYQSAYLVYCYKVMQYLQALTWITEQQKAQKQVEIEQVKAKSASGVKNLEPGPNQESHDFKSLIHQEKIKPNKKIASESSQGTFRGNGLGILASPEPPGFLDAVGGTLSGMARNMGNDLLGSVNSFNNTFIFPATDLIGAGGDALAPLDGMFNTLATSGLPPARGAGIAGYYGRQFLSGFGKVRGFINGLDNTNDVLRTTFRGDGTDIAKVFESGFTARGDSTDLFLHALNNKKPPSAFVSTSTSADMAQTFNKNVFTIRSSNGVDVNKVLGNRSPLPFENEIAIPWQVSPNDIKGVTLTDKSMSILNPNFNKVVQ
jgi:hypothetical protein